MNVVQGYGATIAGGGFNTIFRGESSGGYSVIGGGVGNSTFGDNVTIAGGANNNSSGPGATISGGRYNGSEGFGATIAGGTRNRAANRYATVGGGANNRASGLGAFVGGGGGGEVDETYSDGAPNVASGDWSVVGGGAGNTSSGDKATVDGGLANIASGQIATVGGGERNVSSEMAATIGGGSFNTNSGSYAVIGGGRENIIAAHSSFGTVAGGTENDIGIDSLASTIGGGFNNNIASNSFYSTIAGGNNNNIAANTSYATIPGGEDNAATHYAFAAGRRAKANHTGAFVWGDSSDADVLSTNDNSLTFRASGGVRVFSDGGLSAGVYLAPGSGTWSSLSDRNAKENFTPADARKILDKVAALPLASWNYKAQDKSIRHLGPVAQDFHTAFGVGESDRTITTVDADGVALAAIQGLNQKLEEKLEAKDAELRGLKCQVDELRELVQSLIKQHSP
jgi:hypothetical protein